MEMKTHFNNDKNLLAVQERNTIMVRINLLYFNYFKVSILKRHIISFYIILLKLEIFLN